MATQAELTVEDRVTRFQREASRCAESLIRMGQYLIEDKAALGHGEWLPHLERIGVSQPMAHRLMQVAERFANHSNSNSLPPSLDALVALTRADPERLDQAIEDGEIGPQTTIKGAREFADSASPPAQSEPDEPEVIDAEIVEGEEDRRADKVLALINDLRGPWANGLCREAEGMTKMERDLVADALRDALSRLESME